MTNLDMDNFCVVPWMHLFCNTDGKLGPCCYANDTTFENINGDLSLILNNEKYKKFRKTMLNNEKYHSCRMCNKVESLGDLSLRQNYNNLYLTPELKNHILTNTKPDGTYTNIDIKSMDIRFSNKCNFNCLMCGHFNSNKIYNGKKLHNFKSINNIEEWFDKNLKYFKNLKFLYIAGGEPFIEDNHYKFLECCIKNKLYPSLFYQTNGSILKYKKWDIFKLWENFDVNYSVSIDGVGEIGKYIREGFNEETVFKNIELFKKFSKNRNNKISISIAISFYNAYFLIQLLDKLEKRNLNFNNRLIFNLVLNPNYIQPCVLPKRIKLKTFDKILNSKWYKFYPEKFIGLINNLKEDPTKKQIINFRNYNTKLNNRKNIKIEDIIIDLHHEKV